jgi:hypothetical protein
MPDLTHLHRFAYAHPLFGRFRHAPNLPEITRTSGIALPLYSSRHCHGYLRPPVPNTLTMYQESQHILSIYHGKGVYYPFRRKWSSCPTW